MSEMHNGAEKPLFKTPYKPVRVTAELFFDENLVEQALEDLRKELSSQDNLKRSDLTEFKDAIFERFAEVKANMEKQLDDKADKSQVDDLRGLVKWGGGFATSIAGAFIVYYFTNQ